jgi:hypothetical protein
LDVWEKWIKAHPGAGFGTGGQQANSDSNTHERLTAAIEDGACKPKSNGRYLDFVDAMITKTGRYLACERVCMDLPRDPTLMEDNREALQYYLPKV